jgi:hypothetical protein
MLNKINVADMPRANQYDSARGLMIRYAKPEPKVIDETAISSHPKIFLLNFL